MKRKFWLLIFMFLKTGIAFDEDDWSEWSSWSNCSRSCGGGVAVQSRRCLNVFGCKGNSVRYKVCNEKNCHSEFDKEFKKLRDQQCSDFNDDTYNGKIHDWAPAPLDPKAPCSIKCVSKLKPESPPVLLSPRVLDGKVCGEYSEKVCVHGLCEEIGCDKIIGSGKVTDSCGVCGGDGKACDRRNVLWISRGFTECSSSCGGGYKEALILCADEQTHELVDENFCRHLMKPYPEVFSCARDPCPATWNVEQWSSCSTMCGRGYQLREVSCVQFRNKTKIRVADHECSVPRPLHRKPCESRACPKWFAGIWSECSVTCGEGIQHRAVQCREASGKSSPKCSLATRLPSTRPCQTGVKCPPYELTKSSHFPIERWYKRTPETEEPTVLEAADEKDLSGTDVPAEPTYMADLWGPCSVPCGEGSQKRKVTCKIFLEFSRTVAVLPDSQCTGRKPVDTRKCILSPCKTLMQSESAQNTQKNVNFLTNAESHEKKHHKNPHKKFHHRKKIHHRNKFRNVVSDKKNQKNFQSNRWRIPPLQHNIPVRDISVIDAQNPSSSFTTKSFDELGAFGENEFKNIQQTMVEMNPYKSDQKSNLNNNFDYNNYYYHNPTNNFDRKLKNDNNYQYYNNNSYSEKLDTNDVLIFDEFEKENNVIKAENIANVNENTSKKGNKNKNNENTSKKGNNANKHNSDLINKNDSNKNKNNENSSKNEIETFRSGNYFENGRAPEMSENDIDFETIVRKTEKKVRTKFYWKHVGYTTCSASCLGGVQESIYHCIRKKDGVEYPPYHCDPKTRPDLTTRTCNDFPCPPKWDLPEFGVCSKTCGGGIMKRDVKCTHRLTSSSNRKLVVPNHLCSELMPESTKNCSQIECPPFWEKGEWSKCNVPCGRGFRTRITECVTISAYGKRIKLPEYKCQTIAPKSSRKCNNLSCKRRFSSRRKRPVIKALRGQKYKQRKFMKTVILKVGGKATVFHGVDLKLKCPVRRFDRRNISWWKNGKQIGENYNTRHKVRKTRKGVLKLRKLQYADAGVYICRAESAKGMLTLKVDPLPSSFAGNEKTEDIVKGNTKNEKINVKSKNNLKIKAKENETQSKIQNKKYEKVKNENVRTFSNKLDNEVTEEAGDSKTSGQTLEGAKPKVRHKLNSSKTGTQKSGGTKSGVQKLDNSNTVEQKGDGHETEYHLQKLNGKYGIFRHYEPTSNKSGTNPLNSRTKKYQYGTVSKKETPAKQNRIYGVSLLYDKVAEARLNEVSGVVKVNLSENGPSHPNRSSTSNVYGTLVKKPTEKHKSRHRFRKNKTKVYDIFDSNFFNSLDNNEMKERSIEDFEEDQNSSQAANAKNTTHRESHRKNDSEVTQGKNDSEVTHEKNSSGVSHGTSKVVLETAHFLTSSDLNLPVDETFGTPHILGKADGKNNLEFEWKLAEWSPCSQSCSFSGLSGGYQIRAIECIVRLENVSKVVDGILCEDAGLAPPVTIQRCGFDECPQWEVSAWSDCEISRCYTFNYAHQKRNITCISPQNRSVVKAHRCDDATKPRHRRECYNRECTGVWRTGEWSRCTAPCNGEGYRTRILQCVWNGTRKSAGNACRDTPRPDVVKYCKGAECSKEEYRNSKKNSSCQDQSRYCKIVKRMNMCKVKHYKQKCCHTCQ